MIIELYHDTNAICCQKVELALSEKGLAWTGHRVNLGRGEQLGPDYLKLNPNGVVPTLVHDGRPIIESTVICEYLDDVSPQPALRPSQPAKIAQMRVWTKLVDEVLHEAGSVLSFSAVLGERYKALPAEERDRRYKNVGDPIREDMYRSTVEEGLASPYLTRAVSLFERAFLDMETALTGGSTWIVADQYTLADTGLTPYVARLEYLNILDIWLIGRPRVKRWWKQIMARPSFAAAISGRLNKDDIDAMKTTGTKLRPYVEKTRRTLLAAHDPSAADQTGR